MARSKSDINREYRQKHRVELIRKVREWQLANPEKRVATLRRYYEKHGPLVRARSKERYESKREEVVVVQRAYYEKNRVEKMAYARQRRADYPERSKVIRANCEAMRRAAPGKVTAAEWKEILAFYGHRCGRCERSQNLSMDHYLPLAKGGTNTWDNVWPLCMSCNRRKHATMPKPDVLPHVLATRHSGTDG